MLPSSSLEAATRPIASPPVHTLVAPVLAPSAPAAPAAAAATATRTEQQELLDITVPVLITNLGQAVLPLTSFAYAGRLTDAATLAGLGLGVSVCNITGVCIYYGMGTGIELLCAQAFGAKNNRLVGVAFARGTLLTAFLFIPVAFLWYHMEDILLAFGQQANVAHVTGTFTRAYLWGMVPYAVYENLKRCLQQAQSVVIPVTVVGLLGVLANVVFHHITMVVLGMGVDGAGLALSLTGMFLLITLISFTWMFALGARGCWSGLLSKDIFKHWPGYLAICIPGLTGVFIEWTSIEASIFFAGLLGEKQLATQVMILSAYGIVFQFALSINIGSNIRVGTLLGAGDSEGARKAAWCGIRLALMASAAAVLGYWFGRAQWPLLYGVSEDVLDMIVDLTPIYVAGQVIDMMQIVCNGILKGMGQQRIQAISAGVGFWVVAVPLSAVLGLQLGLGVKGLWIGLAVGEFPLVLFYLYLLRSADWHQCALDAADRVDEHSEFALVEMDAGNLPSDSDSSRSSESSDSDCDSGAGGGPVPGFQAGGGGSEDDEADELEDFYYGGNGGRAIVRGTSGGERVKTDHAGEKVKLATVIPYRHRDDGAGPGMYMIV
ncbi:unnamed protein product [Ectocarpus fasciculatus]